MSKVYLKSRSDYMDFIKCEIPSIIGIRNKVFPSPTEKFIRALRGYEYHFNQEGLHHKLLTLYYYWLWRKYSLKTGITIPRNTCDKGLTLYHYGSIVVNAACEIGRNCCIMNNVNIGANQGSLKAPKIGNNVYIGPGAVIFGDITIADGCYIGANSVVCKSITTPNSVVVGIPGKVIKYDKVHWWEKNGLIRR